MKRIFFYIICITGLSGCSEDFLDRNPIDRISTSSFYKTPEDAQLALVSIYGSLYGGDADFIPLVAEVASDNCFGGAGKGDGYEFQQIDRFQKRAGDDVNEGVWSRGYEGIFRANIFLENIESIDWGDDTDTETRYIAEARFLRAYFYFNLTRFFGEIPLIKQVIKPEDNYPKAPAEEIYAFIAEDLKFAADNLKPADNMAPELNGHITRWASEAMLARVFLFYTGYYARPDIESVLTLEEVRDYIDDVIENSGYELLPDFSSLWLVPAISTGHTYAGEGNTETLFAIKYKFEGSFFYGNGTWQRLIGPRNYAHPPYGQGWGIATVNPKLWFAYRPDDTRRNASILSWEEEGQTPIYDPELDATYDQRQYTGLNWKKNIQRSVVDGSNDVVNPGINGVTAPGWGWQYWIYQDFIEIRFADVLLMGAELHLADDVTKSNNYLKQVRDRAFSNADPSPVTLTGDNPESRAKIFEERRLELAFEGMRYWDLLRQCGNGDFTIIHNAVDNNDPDHTTDDLEGFDVTFRDETLGLFQIPNREISLMNNIIEQNPGY
jgi:hypothetical protein